MKVSRYAMIGIAAAGIAFVSSMTGYVFGVNADSKDAYEKTEKVTKTSSSHKREETVETNETVSETKIVHKYILRELDGYIALFYENSGKEELYEIYDISVNILPKADREVLATGIETESLSEALQLIEDYS